MHGGTKLIFVNLKKKLYYCHWNKLQLSKVLFLNLILAKVSHSVLCCIFKFLYADQIFWKGLVLLLPPLASYSQEENKGSWTSLSMVSWEHWARFASPGSYSFTHIPGDSSIAWPRITPFPFPASGTGLRGRPEQIRTCAIQVKMAQGEVLGHRGPSV